MLDPSKAHSAQPNENTPLTSRPIENSPSWNNSDEEVPFSRDLVFEEFRLLIKDSVPVILAYTLQNSLQTVSVLIIGRSSPENLAASAFSQMFAMVTAWMIALGGTTAMDTLASSSFTGSSKKTDLGILLQRAFLVLGIFYILVALLWACSEPLFLFLGQDPQLSHNSARFLTCLIPGGLGYIYFEAMKKYLQAQGTLPKSYSDYRQLIKYRNHARWDICVIDHISTECRPQSFVLLHIRTWPPGGPSSHRNLLLAFICIASSLRTLHQRLRVLGWMVSRGVPKPSHIRPIGLARSRACWHRMVGL